MVAYLENHRVSGTETTYYVPEFVTKDEEEYLIRKIKESPVARWKQLANRRLQIWGGELTAKKALIPQGMPPFVEKYPDIISRIRETGAFSSSANGAPNHIIMNEYAPGQGIMPHEDGPAYHPVVATLSLGSHTVFHYYQYKPVEDDAEVQGRSIDPAPVLSMLLEPRSLVITTSSLYKQHLHGIEELEEDTFTPSGNPRMANRDMIQGQRERDAIANGGTLRRDIRYSLTCRDVERVAGTALFGKR